MRRKPMGVSVRNTADSHSQTLQRLLVALITLVKNFLHRCTFLALSAFEGLLSLQNHWDDLLSRHGPDIATDKNNFKDAIKSLHALCLCSLPEFLADIKLGAMSRARTPAPNLRVSHCWYVHFSSVIAKYRFIPLYRLLGT